MIERIEAARVPPHVAILEEIDKRRRSAAVIATGLGPVLEMLRAYIVATQARLSELERQERARDSARPEGRL